MMKKLILILLFTFISFNTFAVSFYCSQNNKTVNTDDSPDMLRAACGEPTSVTTRQVTISKPIQVIEWTYAIGPIPTNKVVTTYIPLLIVSFSDNKVFEIKKNGVLVASDIIYCNLTGAIHIGDNQGVVRATCGPPTYINIRQIAHNEVKEYTVWTYNRGPYQPQMIFTFDQGKLTDIQSGQLGN